MKGGPEGDGVAFRMTWLFLGATGGALLVAPGGPALRTAGALAVLGSAFLALRGARTLPVPEEVPRADLEREIRHLRARAEEGDRMRRNILAHLNAGVVLLGGDRQVHLFNAAAQVMLGVSSQLTLGGSLDAAIQEPQSLRNIAAAFQGTFSEWTARRNPRILRLRAIPFASPSEGGASEDWVLLTLDDITHQEALETTRQKFISNASHELKTPTTSMRIAAEDLLEGNLVLPDGETDLRIILRSVDRMTMLLDDISELSRIETGALHLDPQPVQVAAILATLREDLGVQALPRDIRLVFRAEEGLASHVLQTDPLRLRQLLENLLSNAIKFSLPGSEVRLIVRRDGPWLAWAVSDDGPGVAEDDLPRIFERFYRAPSARGVPGTGLGLAIVKHLAVLMDGEVDITSDLGRGATFTLRLPHPGHGSARG